MKPSTRCYHCDTEMRCLGAYAVGDGFLSSYRCGTCGSRVEVREPLPDTTREAREAEALDMLRRGGIGPPCS